LIHRWPRLALLLGGSLSVCVHAASAQTVIVKGAPAGTPVELVLNGTSVATATADAEGLATVAVPSTSQTAPASTTQTRTNVIVDRCGNARRIHLVDVGAGAPANSTCVRESVPWRFMVGRISTFVIDISGPAPSVRLTQGKPPKAWLKKDVPGAEASAWGPTPSGLIVFGGGGLGLIRGLTDHACGDVTCDSTSMKGSLGVGVQYWLTPMIGAEAQYVDPASPTVNGSRTGYRFDSALSSRLITISGLIGAPLGRTRIYGRGGVNRHGVTMTTTQVNEASSVTVDGVTEAIPGHTQTFEIRVDGWSPVVGGGVEGWLSQRIAIYGDVMRAWMSGSSIDAPEGRIDATGWLFHGGIRFRIGGLGRGSQ
jgi:hypothetical protein